MPWHHSAARPGRTLDVLLFGVSALTGFSRQHTGREGLLCPGTGHLGFGELAEGDRVTFGAVRTCDQVAAVSARHSTVGAEGEVRLAVLLVRGTHGSADKLNRPAGRSLQTPTRCISVPLRDQKERVDSNSLALDVLERESEAQGVTE